jgi:hypothetical protein
MTLVPEEVADERSTGKGFGERDVDSLDKTAEGGFVLLVQHKLECY